TYRVRDRDLATVDTTYHGQGAPGIALRADYATFPLPAGIGLYPVTYQYPVPVKRTEYYTANPDVAWEHLFGVTTLESTDAESHISRRTYKPGTYTAGWARAPLGPAFGENQDGTIPDRFYGQAPLVARFIEDLVDSDPRRRLIVFRLPPGEQDVYGSLAVILREELDVTQAALVKETEDRQDAVPDGRETVGNALRQFFPLSREPKKQRRIRRVRKEQGVLGDPRRSMYARWLIFFSWLAAINFWVTAMICVLWLCRDLGTDILNPPSQILLRQIGVQDGQVPFIDDLRRADYRLGDVVTNL
ncbi:hypothetical protein ACFQ1S_31655, partial [Kibdelosporangium lantanae]